MEIKLNEELLSKVVTEEVLRKLKEQEQAIKTLKYECAKRDIIAKVNDSFSFYYYINQYVNLCIDKGTTPTTRKYVEWRENHDVWELYFDLVQKHCLEVVDDIIYENFIEKAIKEVEKEEKEVEQEE